METTLSSKGQVVLPEAIRRKLGLRPGDKLEADVRDGRITLTPRGRPRRKPKIVIDPLTGLPALDAGPDAPMVTNELVRSLLEDFP